MRAHLLILLLAPRPTPAPNTYHPTEAIWRSLKRCDMSDRATTLEHTKFAPTHELPHGGPAFTSLHGGYQYPFPAYTDGRWVPESDGRPSVTGLLPMACDKHDFCPLGTPNCDSSTTANHVCRNYHEMCFNDRRSPLFKDLLTSLKYTWQPVDGCHFTPIAPIPKWHEWSRGLENDAGPMLWIGDTLLAEFFMAFQQLTSGAAHSAFHRADTLVNSWTLAPMTSAEITSCQSTAGLSSGTATVPCPRTTRFVHWEDPRFHQLPHMRWIEALTHAAPSLRTLVIGAGSEWWRQYMYPSMQSGCAGPGGMADAYKPLTALGTVNTVYEDIWRGCDVFDTKFPIMAANVASAINAITTFTGRVIIVTSPPGQRGCATAHTPGASVASGSAVVDDMKKPSFWYDSNPNAYLRDGHGGFHHFGKLKSAEHAWREAFSKHAPRLKFTFLNITSISEARPDGRVRDDHDPMTDDDCQRFCYPGVPHHWSTMMLRLLEQSIYGLHDGMSNKHLGPHGHSPHSHSPHSHSPHSHHPHHPHHP